MISVNRLQSMDDFAAKWAWFPLLVGVIISACVLGYTGYLCFEGEAEKTKLENTPNIIGIVIIGIQIFYSGGRFFQLRSRSELAISEELFDNTPSVCTELGIAGTFAGFVLMLYGYEANGVANGFDFASFFMAMTTSLTGIILAHGFGFYHAYNKLQYRKAIDDVIQDALGDIADSMIEFKENIRFLNAHTNHVAFTFADAGLPEKIKELSQTLTDFSLPEIPEGSEKLGEELKSLVGALKFATGFFGNLTAALGPFLKESQSIQLGKAIENLFAASTALNKFASQKDLEELTNAVNMAKGALAQFESMNIGDISQELTNLLRVAQAEFSKISGTGESVNTALGELASTLGDIATLNIKESLEQLRTKVEALEEMDMSDINDVGKNVAQLSQSISTSYEILAQMLEALKGTSDLPQRMDVVFDRATGAMDEIEKEVKERLTSSLGQVDGASSENTAQFNEVIASINAVKFQIADMREKGLKTYFWKKG